MYHIVTIWRAPPNFHKPWFINSGLTLKQPVMTGVNIPPIKMVAGWLVTIPRSQWRISQSRWMGWFYGSSKAPVIVAIPICSHEIPMKSPQIPKIHQKLLGICRLTDTTGGISHWVSPHCKPQKCCAISSNITGRPRCSLSKGERSWGKNNQKLYSYFWFGS